MKSWFKKKCSPQTIQQETDTLYGAFAELADKFDNLSSKAYEKANNAYELANKLIEEEHYYRQLAEQNYATAFNIRNFVTK